VRRTPSPEWLAAVVERLKYDPETGLVRWISSPRPAVRAGAEAGRVKDDGYRHIGLCYQNYATHQIAWFLHTGEWPALQIDHKNGIKTDNRIANLRQVTHSENQQNKRLAQGNSRSGLLGAHWHVATRVYRARIKLNGKQVYLGEFKTAEEAHACYLRAKLRLHPAFHPVPQPP
jgi:hypothetical protein